MYEQSTVSALWSRPAQLQLWEQIEASALFIHIGYRPNLTISASEVEAATARTGHEVGGFLEVMEDGLRRADAPAEALAMLHYGLTSSDLVETAKQVTLARSHRHLGKLAKELTQAIAVQQELLKPVPGMTHGQVASPTTFQHRWVTCLPGVWWPPLQPAIQLGGAVGRHRVLPEYQCARIARDLAAELREPLLMLMPSTQVLPARHTLRFLSMWLPWVVACEQICLDIRLGASLGHLNLLALAQKVGSSAMPGKINPFEAERVWGLAQDWYSRFHLIASTRALWLDRDLTHSSVDRLNLPMLASHLGYMLELTTKLINRLLVPTVDLAPLEPRIDADLLLAFITKLTGWPRSKAYSELTRLTREKAIANDIGVLDRFAHDHGFDGAEIQEQWERWRS